MKNYELNGINFDVRHRKLTTNDVEVVMEPKVAKLLLVLIQASGQVVTRDELIKLVWDERVVGDSAINRTVSLLRNYLSSFEDKHLFVETLSKTGYKLVCTHIHEINIANGVETVISPKASQFIRGIVLAISVFIIAGFIGFFHIRTIDTVIVGNEAAGAEIVSVVAKIGVEYDVSISELANAMLYHYRDEQSSNQLVLRQLSTGQERVVFDNSQDFINASLSPDGHTIAVVVENSTRCDVRTYTISAKTPRILFTCPKDSSIKLSWHPSGQKLFYRYRVDKTQAFAIYSYDVNTGQTHQISLPEAGTNTRGDYLLSHNHEREELAIARYINEQHTVILVVNSISGDTIRRYELPHSITALNFADQLIVAAPSKLLQLSEKNDRPQTLVTLSRPVQSLAVISSNKQVFFSDLDSQTQIIERDIVAGTSKLWRQSAKLDVLPRAGHNNKMAYLSNQHKGYRIWIANEQRTDHSLTLPFDLDFTRFEWGTESETLLFTKLGAAFEYSLENKQLVELFPSNENAYVANYGRSSNEVIYSKLTGGSWQLWIFDKTKQTHQQLTRFGAYSGRYIEQRLCYSKFSKAGLWCQKPNSEEEELLITNFPMINWLNWTVKGANIYYYEPHSGIRRYNLTSQEDALILKTNADFIHHFSVSDNEQHLYYVERAEIRGDILSIVAN